MDRSLLSESCFSVKNFRSSHRSCVLKNLPISQENTCAGLFLTKLQAFRPETLLKETLKQVFFSEICDIFQNRSSRSQLFFKIGAFKNFATVLESLTNKVAGLRTCNFIKKRLHYVKHVKHKICEIFKNSCFYRTPILKSFDKRLLIEFLT